MSCEIKEGAGLDQQSLRGLGGFKGQGKRRIGRSGGGMLNLAAPITVQVWNHHAASLLINHAQVWNHAP
jgi:hypothetical protein